MTAPDVSRAAWRKSSYSNNLGGACVEITALDGAAWRKSTRSNNQGGACVEITGTGQVIAVRDSKDPSGPHLHFTPPQWQAFVVDLQTGSITFRP